MTPGVQLDGWTEGRQVGEQPERDAASTPLTLGSLPPRLSSQLALCAARRPEEAPRSSPAAKQPPCPSLSVPYAAEMLDLKLKNRKMFRKVSVYHHTSRTDLNKIPH